MLSKLNRYDIQRAVRAGRTSLPNRNRRFRQRRIARRQAYRVIKSVAEKHYHDVTANLFTVSATAQFIDLTDVSLASSDVARIGDKIRALSLDIRFEILVQNDIVPPEASGDFTNTVRVILFQWHQDTVNASPAVSGTGTGILQANNFLAAYNHDNGANFSVFYDRLYGISVGGPGIRTGRLRFKLDSKRGKMKYVRPIIKYSAGTTSGTDKIYMMLVSDSTASAHPNMQFYSRLVFIDN